MFGSYVCRSRTDRNVLGGRRVLGRRVTSMREDDLVREGMPKAALIPLSTPWRIEARRIRHPPPQQDAPSHLQARRSLQPAGERDHRAHGRPWRWRCSTKRNSCPTRKLDDRAPFEVALTEMSHPGRTPRLIASLSTAQPGIRPSTGRIMGKRWISPQTSSTPRNPMTRRENLVHGPARCLVSVARHPCSIVAICIEGTMRRFGRLATTGTGGAKPPSCGCHRWYRRSAKFSSTRRKISDRSSRAGGEGRSCSGVTSGA